MYDEIYLERDIKNHFGIDLEIDKPIVFNVPVGRTANATLFLTANKQLYLFIQGQSHLLLDDVRKITNHMGLKPDMFIPPKGRPNYFFEVGSAKFRQVFPGRKNITENDIRFYRKLAPYNPALILISEIPDGHVYQYDSDSANEWRVAVKFAYRRIRTS